jgi:hypothetical protein
MPECEAGETPQQYFARVLTQCSLESATTAENSSGDSSATPFNIGQIQHDLAQAQEDITALENSDTTQQASLDTLVGQVVGGTENYALAATSVIVNLPSTGTWVIGGITPQEQAMTGVFVNQKTASGFKVNFDAAAAAGTFDWIAIKIS